MFELQRSKSDAGCSLAALARSRGGHSDSPAKVLQPFLLQLLLSTDKVGYLSYCPLALDLSFLDCSYIFYVLCAMCARTIAIHTVLL